MKGRVRPVRASYGTSRVLPIAITKSLDPEKTDGPQSPKSSSKSRPKLDLSLSPRPVASSPRSPRPLSQTLVPEKTTDIQSPRGDYFTQIKEKNKPKERESGRTLAVTAGRHRRNSDVLGDVYPMENMGNFCVIRPIFKFVLSYSLEVPHLFVLSRVNRKFSQLLGPLIKNSSLLEISQKLCEDSAVFGRIELLSWVLDYNFFKPPNYCAITHLAALHGHLHFLKHLLECHKISWNSYTCAAAAKGGNLEVLVWLRENGCEWNETTCAYAALSGNLSVLEWARSMGCPWDNLTERAAVWAGNEDIAQWSRENGCPLPLQIQE